jgi:hypothetical protein
VTRVERCREPTLASYRDCHRVTMNTIDMVLRSLGVLLIFYRAVLISDRWNSRYATLRTFCAEWRERVNAVLGLHEQRHK